MIDTTILTALIHSDMYARRVLPYLAKDYFEDIGHQIAFKLIKDFFTRYNKCPTVESLQIELEESSLSEKPYESANGVFKQLGVLNVDIDWLTDQTENFCRHRAMFNAISKCSEFLVNNDMGKYGMAETLIKDALAVSFDSKLGHDYMEDFVERLEAYHDEQEMLPFNLEMMNRITNGGLKNKTFTVLIAPTGGGKTIWLSNLAAAYLEQGKNVVYISMEMSDTQIAERIDANLLDIDIKMLLKYDRHSFTNRINTLKKKNVGRLIIKQYPNGTAHVGHFRHFLNELKLKKQFIPDVIIVDYLNIIAAQGVGKNANTYEQVKVKAEELRSLCVEFNCRIVTATQTNREGAGSSDFDLTHTSDSFGIPMTADYMFGIIRTKELDAAGKMKVKQLKNRYNDTVTIPSFNISVDYSRMRLSDCEDSDYAEEEPSEGDQIEDKQKQQAFDDRFAALLSGDG